MSQGGKRFLWLAALLVAAAGCVRSVETQTPATANASVSSETQHVSKVSKDPNVKYTRVSLEVPTMSCPFACWPKVRETLESQPGVGEVILAPQKDKDAIDNPVVFVEASDQFQAEQAVEALSKVGFDGAKVAAK